MTWLLRELRLLPIVLVAMTSLFALKMLGLVTSGSYVLGNPGELRAEESLQEKARPYFAADRLARPDITGAVPAKAQEKDPKAEAKPADKDAKPATKTADKDAPAKPDDPKAAEAKAAEAKLKAAGEARVLAAEGRQLSPAERAIIERLQERRQELDQRAREMDIREQLIATAEKRLDERLLELKDAEARINAAMNKRDEAEAAKFKGVVVMYENMKAKEAARIFDRLDMKVLIDVASQINPRRMSDILAQMSAEAAERLTIELASRARTPEKASTAPNDLPKIEGRPNGT